MYEARQNKERVSRRIDAAGGARQMVSVKNNRVRPLQLMKFHNEYISYESNVDEFGRAKKVKAHIKKNAFGNIDGGPPSVDPVGWKYLKETQGPLKGKWVRFHILNQKLGGPGNDCGNLIPTTQTANLDDLWRNFEEYCKQYNSYEGFIFNANIPDYYTVPENAPGFPKAIDIDIYNEKGELIYPYFTSFDLPFVSINLTDFINVHPSLNSMETPDTN